MLMEKSFDKDKNSWDIKLFGDVDLYNLDELKDGLSHLEGADVTIQWRPFKIHRFFWTGRPGGAAEEKQKPGTQSFHQGLKAASLQAF